MITVEDFLFTEDKHKLSDYPDDESVDKVSSFFSCKTNLVSVKIDIKILSAVLFMTLVAQQVGSKNS